MKIDPDPLSGLYEVKEVSSAVQSHFQFHQRYSGDLIVGVSKTAVNVRLVAIFGRVKTPPTASYVPVKSSVIPSNFIPSPGMILARVLSVAEFTSLQE